MPGNGCVFYTATVVNSPRQIEDDIAWVRRKLRSLVLQAIRTETEPVIAEARRKLDEERDEFFVNHDWLGQRFPEEPKHLQDKDLRVHYFVKKSLSWYAPNIRP